MDKPRIYVDFNEMVAEGIYLLSKDDTKTDSDGNTVTFYENMPVSIYSDDETAGKTDNLIAEGVAVKYDLSRYGRWAHVKWCVRICGDIMHESDLFKRTNELSGKKHLRQNQQ